MCISHFVYPLMRQIIKFRECDLKDNISLGKGIITYIEDQIGVFEQPSLQMFHHNISIL